MIKRTGGCEGKRTFTEQEAREELAKIIVMAMTRQRVRVHHQETGVYECSRCGWWHLTSRPVDQMVIRPGEAR